MLKSDRGDKKALDMCHSHVARGLEMTKKQPTPLVSWSVIITSVKMGDEHTVLLGVGHWGGI